MHRKTAIMALCSRCAGSVDPGSKIRATWGDLVLAIQNDAGREELGKALRAWYGLAPGFEPMRDPAGDRVFLDWICGAFNLAPQRAADAFYDHDTAAFTSGAHKAYTSGAFPAYKGQDA